ncbi:MAG TPA: hypothetical protein VFM18_01460, partial [Methanosarcina sp.]|nr:hypothetical protein [Methanosarcina sp.]
IRGQGRATTVKKSSDVILFDLSGSHPASTTTVTKQGQVIEDITLDGGDIGTQPLIRCYYTSMAMFKNVVFWGNPGPAVDGVEWWDSYFINCRFDHTGGRAGTGVPSVWIRGTNGAGSGMGHSTDNSNNIYFTDCVWESFYEGAVYYEGTASSKANKCYMTNCKIESTLIRGFPWIKLNYTEDIVFQSVNLSAGNFDSGYSTAINLIELNESYKTGINDVFMEFWGSTRTVTSGIKFTGNANATSMKNITGVCSATNAPVSLIDFNTFANGSRPSNNQVEGCKWTYTSTANPVNIKGYPGNYINKFVITPEDYGAVGDGTTNDAGNLQAMFDAVGSTTYSATAG